MHLKLRPDSNTSDKRMKLEVVFNWFPEDEAILLIQRIVRGHLSRVKYGMYHHYDNDIDERQFEQKMASPSYIMGIRIIFACDDGMSQLIS